MPFTSTQEILANMAPKSRLLLAVSGGGDSLAMLHWFVSDNSLRHRIVASHVNHGLNDDAADIQADVRRTANEIGVPFVSETVDVRAELAKQQDSIEACARRLRYAALERMRSETDCDFIVTAHTLDDDAETVYMKLKQRSSWFEQTGIPELRGVILRPFLGIRRSVLRSALPPGNEFHDDPMNRDLRFLRVQARTELASLKHKLPEITTLLAGHGQNTTRSLNLAARLLKSYNYNSLTHVPDPSLMLECLPKNLYLEGLGFQWVEQALSGHMNEPEFRLSACNRRQILAFLKGNSPMAKLALTPNYSLHRAGTKFWIKRDDDSQDLAYEFPLIKNGHEIRTPFSYANQSTGQLELDSSSIRGELVARPWKTGERFRPNNRRTRKIADWLYDGGVHPAVRHNWPILQDDEGIVAIPGLGICERVMVRSGTNNLLIRWKAIASRADSIS